MVEKAYPTLQVETQELLVLNQFLTQIENQQLAFAVRQRAPTTVDAAVASVLELETYLDVRRREDEVIIASAGRMRVAGIWDKLLERVEKLERLFETTQSAKVGQDPFGRVLERHEKLETSVAAREKALNQKQTGEDAVATVFVHGEQHCM